MSLRFGVIGRETVTCRVAVLSRNPFHHPGRQLALVAPGAHLGVTMSTLARSTLRELGQFTRLYRPNVLIIGDIPRSDREEVLDTVKRHRGLDLFRAQRPAFDLPSHPAVILVLDDACELSPDHQRRLLEWVSRNHVQIVSFASRSLYEMVCEHKFIDRLYYHLNTVCVIAGDP